MGPCDHRVIYRHPLVLFSRSFINDLNDDYSDKNNRNKKHLLMFPHLEDDNNNAYLAGTS